MAPLVNQTIFFHLPSLYRLAHFFSSGSNDPIPIACSAPSTGVTQAARCSVKISVCGFNTVSCNLWSSIGPPRMNLVPGATAPCRHMIVPHVGQNAFVIRLCLGIVESCSKRTRCDSPRVYRVCVSSVVRLVANIDAEMLRQSEQWQTNVLTRPGGLMGCKRRSRAIAKGRRRGRC